MTEPGDLVAARDWFPVDVPGTAAGALRAAGAELDRDLDVDDWWFCTELADGAPDGSVLVLPGVATLAEVWLGGELVAATTSMFLTVEVVVPAQPPGALLAIRCLSLRAALAVRRPRGRWRSSLVAEQGLRHVRTTLLGRASVFAGAAPPVGPWRGCELHAPTTPRVSRRRVTAQLAGSTGTVHAACLVHGYDPGPTQLVVGDVSAPVTLVADGDGVRLEGEVSVPDAPVWWPHTHGAQPLLDVVLRVGGLDHALGTVGFRTVGLDRSDGRFTLSLNGSAVFARGAVWAPPDPVGHVPDEAHTREVLAQLVRAGLNVVRVPGTGVYETAEFYLACAELGVLVWQDVMLATTDPADGPARELLLAEVGELCGRLAGNPAVTVVSGGSETEQQPTLLGLPADQRGLPVLAEVTDVVAELLPGVATITSSPTGGALPTHVGDGVSHWFGVGAYLRPLRDVREAGVRFAAECLAFATPPDPSAVERHFGGAAVAGHDPAWKGGSAPRPWLVVGLRGRARPLRACRAR